MNQGKTVQAQEEDAAEARHAVLCEIRLLADITVSMRPQALMVESEHLATTLVSFARRVDGAIRMIAPRQSRKPRRDPLLRY